MTTPASSTSSRTPFGKSLVRAAVRAGRLVNQLETGILYSRVLAAVPFKYRQIGFQSFKVMFVLAAASVAILLAIGMIAVWTIAALPISADRQPRIHEVSHPQHQLKYPELYDDNGALR
ncbi:hypothetical protein [Pseudomonas sp. BF-R-19]|jgi:hypothetical protein|uniref:hypothetical protein n=1 Tax=Pseudomonas sp. BF-R-19 TaxID=2832397 RepID=UPI001CBB1501|nr:hypothetical protein [Pseudomonas sp. BF-R-19]